MFEIEGKHTTATVMGEPDMFDETFVEQVRFSHHCRSRVLTLDLEHRYLPSL